MGLFLLEKITVYYASHPIIKGSLALLFFWFTVAHTYTILLTQCLLTIVVSLHECFQWQCMASEGGSPQW